MRKIVIPGLLAFFVSFACAEEPKSEAVEKAKIAAESWLALADSAQYSATWEQAAAFFQAAIKQSDWESAMMSTRASVGPMETRVLASASFMERLPGAPAGQYVVIQFNGQFANKKNAVETITPMLDKDGVWRVSGYFIK